MNWMHGHTAEWEVYEEGMRRWNAGERRDKPRAPFQRGRHIDTLPTEQNGPADNLPIEFDAAAAAYAAGCKAGADCDIAHLHREAVAHAAERRGDDSTSTNGTP